MVPIVAIAVVVAVVVLALAASAALAYKYRPGRRQAAAAGFGAGDDLEKEADAPTRKMQIRRGRVVSWHSTAKSIRGFTRMPTPKMFSSRPSSTASLPRTIDLEREIASFRQDYARAKELEAEHPGAAYSATGLVPVSRLQTPRPVRQAKVLSAIDEDDPADLLKESSWETYNGHREGNHPLSSFLGPLSPSLEKAIEVNDIESALSSVVRSPPLAKSNSSAASYARSDGSESHDPTPATDPGPRRSQSGFPTITAQPPPQRPGLPRLDTLNLAAVLAARSPPSGNEADPTSPSAFSIQSAIYKSPIHEFVTAAPQPRKPSKLDLRGSFSKTDYGFPSPPATTTSAVTPSSPSQATLSSAVATLGGGTSTNPDRYSYSEHLREGDFMDLESVTTRSHSRCSRAASATSRATSRRRSRSRSSTHRVRKRPAPLSITEAVPPLPGQTPKTPTQEEPLDTGAFLASPTASDAASLKSSRHARKSTRASTYSVASSAYSPFSPTFAVTPVFRVPLYAGKGVSGPKLRTISKRTARDFLPNGGDELVRRGSDGDVVQVPTRKLERPSVLRNHTTTELDGPAWPPLQLKSMLRQAHDMAGSTAPISPEANPAPSVAPQASLLVSKPTEARPPMARATTLAQLRMRPILKNNRSVSHSVESPIDAGARPSATLTRTVSANVLVPTSRNGSLDDKALPPLPPVTPTMPSGVQRVPVSTMRTEHPDVVSEMKPAVIKPAVAVSNPNLPSARPAKPRMPERKRSGLDRIAGAVLLKAKPTTTVGKTGIAIGPTVKTREVARKDSSTSQSSQSTCEAALEHPTSPAISAVSNTPTPEAKPKRAPNRMAANRPWEIISAVSPLSTDFPMSVTA